MSHVARQGFGFDVCFLTFILGHILHLHLPHLRHVAQHGEDDKPRQEAGHAVHKAGHDGITVEKRAAPLTRAWIKKTACTKQYFRPSERSQSHLTVCSKVSCHECLTHGIIFWHTRAHWPGVWKGRGNLKGNWMAFKHFNPKSWS